MSIRYRRLAGYVAAALACVMVGTALPTVMPQQAIAEPETQVVVHTSPFTAAVAQVRSSVVGVSNYKTVRTNTNPAFPGFGFGFGYGFGYGFGNGYGDDSYEEREVESSTGSGVVVGTGYVLTNYHVVEGATALKVTVPNEETGETDTYEASLVAYDQAIDIAVIYVKDLPLQPVTLGDSDTLQVGDWAICIGNPLGREFSGTVTAGIVSALNRNVSSSGTDRYGRRETTVNAMIQVDAAINNGNSGGGMFSVTGELMGIPTLKYSGSYYSSASVEGIGMCIPINAAKPLIEEVLSGRITAQEPSEPTGSSENNGQTTAGLAMEDKPRMGITMTSINTNSSAVRNGYVPNGVYVVEVEEGSPAEQAGMLPGDIIVDVEGSVITSPSAIQQIVSRYAAGDTLKVKVFRIRDTSAAVPEGDYIDLEVTLAVLSEAVRQ